MALPHRSRQAFSASGLKGLSDEALQRLKVALLAEEGVRSAEADPMHMWFASPALPPYDWEGQDPEQLGTPLQWDPLTEQMVPVA